jgi:hypothetical protein
MRATARPKKTIRSPVTRYLPDAAFWSGNSTEIVFKGPSRVCCAVPDGWRASFRILAKVFLMSVSMLGT